VSGERTHRLGVEQPSMTEVHRAQGQAPATITAEI